jgi:hypothetical protein
MTHNDIKQASVFSRDDINDKITSKAFRFTIEMVFMMKMAMHISYIMKSLFMY